MASLEGNMSETQSTPVEGINDCSSISSHKMTSEEQDVKYFDFFGLPRELRDMVYVKLLVDEILDEEKILGVTDFDLWIFGCTKTELLMVNHQFRVEYKAVSKLHATVCLEDRGCSYQLFYRGAMDRLLDRAPQVEIVVLVWPESPAAWGYTHDVHYHRDQLEELFMDQGRPSHFNVTAVLGIDDGDTASEEQLVKELLQLTKLRRLNILRICIQAEDPNTEYTPFYDHCAMRYRWTRQDPLMKKQPGPKHSPVQVAPSDTSLKPESLATSATHYVEEATNNESNNHSALDEATTTNRKT